MKQKDPVTRRPSPQPESWRRAMRRSAKRSANSLFNMVPIMLATLLLTSLLVRFIPDLFATGLFGHTPLSDALMGATVGGIATGQPVVSYLLGGELSGSGVTLIGVTALVVAWVTVGVTHLPVEISAFGWRYAVVRNLLNFLFALASAFMMVAILDVFT